MQTQEQFDAARDREELVRKLSDALLQIDAIKMAFGLHSCPPENAFCWRCNAMEVVEKTLSEKRKCEHDWNLSDCTDTECRKCGQHR